MHRGLAYLRVGKYTQRFCLPQGMYIYTEVWFTSGYVYIHRGSALLKVCINTQRFGLAQGMYIYTEVWFSSR